MNWSYNDLRRKKRGSFISALLLLIGHLMGSAVVVTIVVFLAWLIGVVIHTLNGIRPFDLDEFALIHKIQVGILIVDLMLAAIFLVAGIKRFIKDVGDRS